MQSTTQSPSVTQSSASEGLVEDSSAVAQIAVLGREVNANQYRIVRLAAQYDSGREWFRHGYASPALPIARILDIHTSTAREWIRVGHSLDSCLKYMKRSPPTPCRMPKHGY